MASPTSLLSLTSSSLTLSPYSHSLSHRTPLFRFLSTPNSKPFLRGSLCVTRLGFRPEAEFGGGEAIADLFRKAEGLLYTIADAAVSSSTAAGETASETVTDAKQSGDWLSGITYYMESVLKVLKDGFSALHVPYSYGFAIILLTILVKAVTFPLTKKQVESAMAMRSLQPQIKAIQQRYAGDKERLQLETARLYKLAGINPLAGCLPTLATIPVWIGLYRALSNVADEGLLTEGFFWIPSLAGPTTIAARQNGSGISWLFPFVDGHPPLGWSDTLAYLVLPVLLVLSQYISVQIMQSSQSNDPNMKNSQALTKFLPLMIGYFALSVPSGLSLYWFTNNILSTAQQLWLQKLGGASNPLNQFNIDAIQQEVKKKDTVKQDEVQSGSEFKSTLKPPKEKLTVDGPRPGERFKQIKEQEARRKQEREEQKKRAEAIAAVKTQTADVLHQNERKELEMNGGPRNDIHEYNSSTRNSSNGGLIANSGLSSSTLNGDANVENGDASTNHQVEEPDDQHR